MHILYLGSNSTPTGLLGGEGDHLQRWAKTVPPTCKVADRNLVRLNMLAEVQCKFGMFLNWVGACEGLIWWSWSIPALLSRGVVFPGCFRPIR